jgi:hypothetical protein
VLGSSILRGELQVWSQQVNEHLGSVGVQLVSRQLQLLPKAWLQLHELCYFHITQVVSRGQTVVHSLGLGLSGGDPLVVDGGLCLEGGMAPAARRVRHAIFA